MGRIAGQRRGETYPGRGAGGGDLASIPPLSRQRFIDGDTANPGQGSIAQPFATIASFMASRGDASIADATANYVGWLMPALNGYAEAVAFPPYVSTELRADSFTGVPGSGALVTGNVTWNNAGGGAKATQAVVCMHNISVIGTFSVTDDVGAPPSFVLIGADESGDASVEITGGFDSTTASNLSEVSFYNAAVAGTGITAGTAPGSAAVAMVNSSCAAGAVSGSSLAALNCIFGASSISVSGASAFVNCQFTITSSPLLANGGADTGFDGPSWISFIQAGGTRAVGTTVLVAGGYNGAPVEGAALPTTTSATNVSLNGTGASAGYTGEHSGNHYSSSGLTQDNVTVAMKTGGGEKVGDTMLITKTDLAAHALTVNNNAGGIIGVIPSGSRGFVLAQYVAGSTNDWVLAECGSLAA